MDERKICLLHKGDYIENKTKIGGQPNWIQKIKIPICSYCNEKLKFYCQIDTKFNDIKEYLIADAGMIYVFICNGCGNIKSILQTF